MESNENNMAEDVLSSDQLVDSSVSGPKLPKRRRTPNKAYCDHKSQAKDRDLDFNLSYAEWLEMWLVSDKYSQRGKEKGNYQMCRYYDEGGYSLENCYIGTVEQNQQDRHQIPDGQTGEIIRNWLSGAYTQYELAEMWELDQSSISKIVNGKQRGCESYER